jgi:aminoglycoside/choline kinase family phosphotransferase
MGIEAELLLDWYWPMMKGEPAPESERAKFLALWAPLFAFVTAEDPCLVLRDYHSPNLMWMPERGADPLASVGLIDFQDAMLGHPAYDLVSLLQDARLDVPADIEAALLAHYGKAVAAEVKGYDQSSFERAYAIMGAQRNTKILGIFARLARRDGKRAYLAHIPRIWTNLARDLTHPSLRELAAWYDTHFPAAIRATPPKA